MAKKTKIELIIEEENQIQRFEDLFQLWKDIPIVKNLKDNSLYRAINHPIQSAILKILREGIIDPDGRKRHFLIANELLEAVNVELEGLEKSIKISMLYYHLDKLQESKLVGYVYYVEGRHKRKYFGRTAKFYLFSDTKKEQRLMDKYFEPISKLIRHFNPDADLETYRAAIEKIKDRQFAYSEAVVEWMRENHKLLYELDIDALDLFTALNSLLINQESMKQLYSGLSEHMKFLE